MRTLHLLKIIIFMEVSYFMVVMMISSNTISPSSGNNHLNKCFLIYERKYNLILCKQYRRISVSYLFHTCMKYYNYNLLFNVYLFRMHSNQSNDKSKFNEISSSNNIAESVSDTYFISVNDN